MELGPYWRSLGKREVSLRCGLMKEALNRILEATMVINSGYYTPALLSH